MEEDQKQGRPSEYGSNEEQMLMFRGRTYVPNRESLKGLILDEYHRSNYAGHPGYQKMLSAIRNIFYWPGMRRDVAGYLSKCLEF